MKPSILIWLGVMLAASPAFSTILINEANVNPPGTVSATEGDGNFEFVELISTTGGVESCDNLWLLQVDVRGGGIGEVKEAWNLTGLATGTNALLLLGDGYDNNPFGGPWANAKGAATTVGDPPQMGGDNLDDNDAFCLLLVQNFTGTAESSTNPNGSDLDHDDNGGLSVIAGQLLPWASGANSGLSGVIDSVGFSDRAEVPRKPPLAGANLTRVAAPIFDPDNVSRKLGNTTANNAAAWYGGDIDGNSLFSVAFNITNHFGLTGGPGEATPGLPNLAAALPPAVIRLNEVSLNPPGGDDLNAEYIELISTNRTNASLTGYTLVVIDSNDDGAVGMQFGEIVEAWTLDGLATGSNGLILLGNGYSRNFTPWRSFVDPSTAVADPTGMGDNDIGDNNGFTLLLVKGFNGVAQTDTTPGTDLDADENGVLDGPRWTEIVDDIGLDQWDDENPTATNLGKTYAQTKIVTAPRYDVDLLSRKLNDVGALSPASWYGGDYGGNSPLTISLKDDPIRPLFGGFKGEATPGRLNLGSNAQPGPIRLNEITLDPVESSDPTVSNEEYIELISQSLAATGMNGLTLLIVDGHLPGLGEIKEAIDLSGLSTGPNGLMLIGDSYDTGTPYGAEVSPLTHREDPPGYDAGNIEDEKLGVAILIVSGFSGSTGQDIDADDDGDWETRPWVTLVDSIAIGQVETSDVANVSQPNFLPRVLVRNTGNLSANNADSWHGGDFAPNQTLLFGDNRFGINFRSAASPGRYNHCAQPNLGNLLINEVMINLPGGGDANQEYIELISTSGAAESTNGYTLLMLDSSVGTSLTGNVGNVLEAWSLDGLCTGSNGLLLIGDNYPTAGVPYAGADAISPRTALGDPAGLDPEDVGRDGDNGAISLLLVKNFTGQIEEDLDTVGGVGTPPAGDGTLDSQPWTTLNDGVGHRFWNPAPVDATGDPVPPRLEGVVYGFVNLSQTDYTPDNLSRTRGNLVPNNVTAWYGGDIETGTLTTYSATQRFPLAFAGKATPGNLNIADAAYYAGDPDGDTVTNLVEEALIMNPFAIDNGRLPEPSLVPDAGQNYGAITFTELKGGTGTKGVDYTAGGFHYAVETTTDLVTWVPATASDVTVVSAVDQPDGISELVTIRSTAAHPMQFLRLRITRP